MRPPCSAGATRPASYPSAGFLRGLFPLLLLLAVMPGAGGHPAWGATSPPAATPAVHPGAAGRGVTPDEARVCLLPVAPGPPLEAFGTVIWRGTLILGPAQAACLGDLYYGPGARVDVGLLTSRYRDRIYLRTGRRLLREWALPAVGQPDSARGWAAGLLGRFGGPDTLFLDLGGAAGPAPTLAAGKRAGRLTTLFTHWVARDFGAGDQQEALALGLPAARFKDPPPETACAPGGG